MSTPANAVRPATKDAKVDLINAANANFVINADKAISDAAGRGLFLARLELQPNVNLQYVVIYYQNLGYTVSAPLPPNIGNQPAQLFGEFWNYYWENPTFYYIINGFPKIKEIFITWNNPFPHSPYPIGFGNF